MNLNEIDSPMLIELLRNKHSDDIFVTECKDGPTCYGMQRFDAWAMKRSWSNPLVIVYEIKVSRTDFLNDNKYRNYLEYCNELYLVTPPGLVKTNELPDVIGLLECSKNCKTLYIRKKAVYRGVIIPESVFRYILMSRTLIKHNEYDSHDLKYWQDWIKNKTECKLTGLRIKSKLREHIVNLESENNRLKSLFSSYDDIRNYLKELDIEINVPVRRWQIDGVLSVRDKAVFLRHLDNLSIAVKRLKTDLTTGNLFK